MLGQEEDYEIELRLILKLFGKQLTSRSRGRWKLILLCLVVTVKDL
jgi:hypothetical protein